MYRRFYETPHEGHSPVPVWREWFDVEVGYQRLTSMRGRSVPVRVEEALDGDGVEITFRSRQDYDLLLEDYWADLQ